MHFTGSGLRCKYEYSYRFCRPMHLWSVVGARGGLHVWIVPAYGSGGMEVPAHGGVEMHSRTPLYGNEAAPSDDRCWLLNCPCWHDGSSLAAEEFWIPFWKSDPHNHEGMFDLLRGEYFKRFQVED